MSNVVNLDSRRTDQEIWDCAMRALDKSMEDAKNLVFALAPDEAWKNATREVDDALDSLEALLTRISENETHLDRLPSTGASRDETS